MGLNATSRVVLAAGLILTALLLHGWLCIWLLTPVMSLDPQNEFLWLITVERGSYPQTGQPVWMCRGLMRSIDDSQSIAWTFGVAFPVLFVFTAAALLIGVRPLRRLERGRCPHCSYDLKFDTSRPCPECGWRG